MKGGLYIFCSLAAAPFLAAAAQAPSAANSAAAPQTEPVPLPIVSSARGIDPKTLRIDASSPERLQESFIQMLTLLDDNTQQALAAAMATIGVVMNEDPKLGGQEAVMKLINGKTADEIIAASRRLTPFIKQHSNIIDGSTAEAFGKSVSRLLVSLPADRQGEFSEALAKLMYEAKKNGKPETDIIKELDGKTAIEVIELAKRVDLPFEVARRANPEQFEISPIRDADLKKYNLPKSTGGKADPDAKPLDYGESLVP